MFCKKHKFLVNCTTTHVILPPDAIYMISWLQLTRNLCFLQNTIQYSTGIVDYSDISCVISIITYDDEKGSPINTIFNKKTFDGMCILVKG